MANTSCRGRFEKLLVFKTARVAYVHAPGLALFRYILMIVIGVYIVVFQLAIKKGYQATDTVQGAFSLKGA